VAPAGAGSSSSSDEGDKINGYTRFGFLATD
jgi:hypothetical protein